jgi:hypothetical protein
MALPYRETVASTGVVYHAPPSDLVVGGVAPGLILINTATGVIIGIRKVANNDNYWVLPSKSHVQQATASSDPQICERLNAAEASTVLPPSISICILRSDVCVQLQEHPKFRLWMKLSDFSEVLNKVVDNPTSKQSWCYIPGCVIYSQEHGMEITCVVDANATITVSHHLTTRQHLFNPLGWNTLWAKCTKAIRQDMKYPEQIDQGTASITSDDLDCVWYKYLNRLSTKFSLYVPYFIFYSVLVLRKRKVTIVPGLEVDYHRVLFWFFRSMFLASTYKQLFSGLHHLSTLLLNMLPYESDPTSDCVQCLIKQLSMLADSAVNFPYYSIDHQIVETLVKSIVVIFESPCQLDITVHIPQASRLALKRKRDHDEAQNPHTRFNFYQKHVRVLHSDIPSKQLSLCLNKQWTTLPRMSHVQMVNCIVPTVSTPSSITSLPLWAIMWTYTGCKLFAAPRVINNQPYGVELFDTLNSMSVIDVLRTPVSCHTAAIKRLIQACQQSWETVCPLLTYVEEQRDPNVQNLDIECSIYKLLPALIGPITVWQQSTVANKNVQWFCTLPVPGENQSEALPHRALPRVNLEYQTVNGVCIGDIENKHFNGSLEAACKVKTVLTSRGFPMKSTDLHRIFKHLQWYKKAQQWKLTYKDNKYWLVGTDKKGHPTTMTWKHASDIKNTYPVLPATPDYLLQRMKQSLGGVHTPNGFLLEKDILKCWRQESSKQLAHLGIRQQADHIIAELLTCLSQIECYAVVRLVQNMPTSFNLSDWQEGKSSTLWSGPAEKSCTLVRLFRFFVYVSWQYSGILQPSTNLKTVGDFEIVRGNYPAFWWLCNRLKHMAVNTLDAMIQTEPSRRVMYHSPVLSTTATAWPLLSPDGEQKDERVLTYQQQKQLGYLIQRHEDSKSRATSCGLTVCLPVGSGKTLVMLKFMEYLMHNGALPDVVLMAITPESLTSIHEEIRKIGFEVCHILPLSGDSFQCTIAGCPQIRGSAAQLQPFRICLIFHDHLIRFVSEYNADLHQLSKQLFFVFDEVDKISHSSTIRRYTCVDLLTSLSLISLFMSGTPLQQKMDGMIKLLPHTCENPVTKKNVVALMTADIQSMWDMPVEPTAQPRPLLENWRWNKKMRIVSLTAEEMENDLEQKCTTQTIEAHSVSTSVTNTLIDTALGYIQGSSRSRVLVVAANSAHRDLIFSSLYKRMQKLQKYKHGPNQRSTVEQALVKVSQTNSVSITPGSLLGKTVDVVVVASSDNRGYHLTTLSVMVTSVYNMTPQDQRQMEGRMSRLGQQRRTLTKVTVLTELQQKYIQRNNEVGSYMAGLEAAQFTGETAAN